MAPKPENALVVHVFAYPTTDGGTGPDTEGTRPLENVQVAVKASGKTPPSPVRTDPDGFARFPSLPEATDYKITVTPPVVLNPPVNAYGPPKEMFSNGRVLKVADTVAVREGGEVLVHVGLTPVAGRVTGAVTVPGLADPSGIRVEARVAGRLIDSALVAAEAGGTGRFIYDLANIDEPGLVEIRPEPSKDFGGLTYVPKAGQESRFILAPPGKPVTLDVEYELTRAEIRVGAQLVEASDGRVERRPLPGVTFRLFRAGEEQPLRELTTQRQTASVFSDVAAGSYRLVAVAPAANDARRLQLTRPPGPGLTLQIAEGEHLDLRNEFEFQPAKGSVLGSVVFSHDQAPVPGVAVVVTSQQQPQLLRRVVTDSDGEFLIGELPEGDYQVALEQQVVTALGRRWEQEALPGTRETVRTVEVRGRATSVVPEFRLTEDQHLVSGRVFGPGGFGAPFVTVQVFEDTDTSKGPILNVLTDQQGFYRFRAPSAGTFFLQVLQSNGITPQLAPVTVNSPATAPPLFTTTGLVVPPATGAAVNTPPIVPVQADNDFPFLTQDVELDGRTGGSAGRLGSAAGGVGRMVEREIREVLGWRPRAADPKGFQAALQQAFTVREVAGHTEVDWKPRSYSVDIQADLGAITGAQASIHARAKGALEDVLPLLDGLTALRVDADDENVAAIRAIVRSQLSELVAELGVEGGPRVQRVDQLLDFLLGPPQRDPLGRPDRGPLRDPAKVGGSLGVLRDRLGLIRERINTIDEEQNFTNFLVVIDHAAGLAESWDAQRDFFVRGGTVEPFLGTQLVLLSRDLEVITESVHEVEFAMDSVFLGPAERQTLELRFPVDFTRPLVSGSPPLFVSELLGWVERFASEEGRQLIDEGGRQGVAVAFRPTLELLQALVEAALVSPAGMQDPFRLPAAYRRQRVQRALAELAQQLDAAADRVQLIKPPVEDVVPTPPVAQPPPAPPPRPRPPRGFLPDTDEDVEQPKDDAVR